MTIGEIDLGDIPETSGHRWLFQLFLVAFIFFIIVAYMNFMNGLAVQDIRLLKEDADIARNVQIIDLIFYSELMLLGDPNEFWGKWTPFKMARNFFGQTIRQQINKLMRAHKILLLEKGNTTWKFSWDPSDKDRSCFDIDVVPKEILNAIEKVLETKEAKEKEANIMQDIRRLEVKLDKIISALKNQ